MSSESHKQRVRNFQRSHGLTVDGIDGPKTWDVINSLSAKCSMHPEPKSVKLEKGYRTNQLSESELQAKYGRAGNEAVLDWFDMPFTMYLYGDKSHPISQHRCHKRMVKPLEQLLKAWLEELGIDFIRKHRLDHYYGCYNNRNIRNGTSKSRHARGIAIDIDAANNSNRSKWDPKKIGQSGYATMPVEAINIANRLGWICGATAWGRDAMHFQLD